MKRFDFATGVAMFLLSGVVLIATWPLTYWSDFAPGPAFMPRWVAGGGMVIALLLLASRLRGSASPGAAVEDETPFHLERPATALVALVALGALFPLLGLRLAAAVFVLSRCWSSCVAAVLCGYRGDGAHRAWCLSGGWPSISHRTCSASDVDTFAFCSAGLTSR
jgi:hypothetical protein